MVSKDRTLVINACGTKSLMKGGKQWTYMTD